MVFILLDFWRKDTIKNPNTKAKEINVTRISMIYLVVSFFLRKFVRKLCSNHPFSVPPYYHVEELTRQLTEYGELLIANKTKATEKKKRYRHESLRGLMNGVSASSEELIEEYLQEKYGT
ncbi:MAG: hypothetical protein IJP74_11015 [Prevotella sp.]|nr:hypothetical protein [Prevotella sp.]